eukprot:TRINITY_DN4799_c0_g1_i3.p3 TRINITY_DN4799_c0_g1~~TRINITY_DN4799_c0_g1_i3.p3  ORF type:complete len:110 (-),score=6.57 TRINITY_DN4799_c0_g1_i3:1767-2096(-)
MCAAWREDGFAGPAWFDGGDQLTNAETSCDVGPPTKCRSLGPDNAMPGADNATSSGWNFGHAQLLPQGVALSAPDIALSTPGVHFQRRNATRAGILRPFDDIESTSALF